MCAKVRFKFTSNLLTEISFISNYIKYVVSFAKCIPLDNIVLIFYMSPSTLRKSTVKKISRGGEGCVGEWTFSRSTQGGTFSPL